MDWEDIGRAAGRFFLAALEYSFKICAIVATAIALGTGGTFADKFTTSFSALPGALRRLVEVPGKLMDMGTLIHDYHSQTIAAFTKSYGVGATNNLLMTLNNGVEYIIGVYENFISGPLATVAAVFLVFSSFYLLARVLRFARQKGRGSFGVRLERKLAERIYNSTASTIPYRSAPVRSRKAGSVKTKRRLNMPVSDNSKSKSNIKIPNKPPGRKQGYGAIRGFNDNDYGPDADTLTFLLESARS